MRMTRLRPSPALAVRGSGGDPRRPPSASRPTPPAGQTADDPVLARGATLYRIHCASCHGSQGRRRRSGRLRAADEAVRSHLARAASRRQVPRGARCAPPSTAAPTVAAHGAREMPVWGLSFAEPRARRSDEKARSQAEIRALVRYLASLPARSVLLATAHREHRTGRALHHALGDRAEHQLAQGAAAVRSHRDQVDLALLGEPLDDAGRRSFGHLGRDLPTRGRELGRPLLELGLGGVATPPRGSSSWRAECRRPRTRPACGRRAPGSARPCRARR